MQNKRRIVDCLEFEDGDKYNLIRFECDGTTLSGLVSNRGYETTMVLDTINVLGISGQIKSIVINSKPHSDFTSFYHDEVSEFVKILDYFHSFNNHDNACVFLAA